MNVSDMQPKPIRWSYSGLDKFATCAHRYYRQYVKKDVVDPGSPESEWGNYVHKAIENFLMDDAPLPANVTQAYGRPLSQVLPQLQQVADLRVEHHFAIDEGARAIDPEHPYCWAHGFADVVAINDAGTHAIIGDWKTGKPRGSDQLKLYAVMLFAAVPSLQQINTAYWWLAHSKVTGETVYPEYGHRMLDPFRAKYARLCTAVADDNWPKQPNALCRGYCPVKDCEFNKPKRTY